MSLRKIAKEMGISPAYLSYMVNGKRPWREDLREQYAAFVNTTVNTTAQEVNAIREKPPFQMASISYEITGGSARESNPPTPLVTRHNGFEVRKSHRAPSTPIIACVGDAFTLANKRRRRKAASCLSPFPYL